MKSIRLVLLIAMLAVLARVSFASEPVTDSSRAAVALKPKVQIALLLDTSGSMDGLISQAKTQLWKIVNEFALSRKNGVRPDLQVALYEYGKQSIPASENFLRQIVPLTADLDKVSEELFKLTTNGGEEYCGAAIKAATEGLAWSASNSDFKAIFICGNEPFTQGSINYAEACKAAISKGIIINTIHCGNENTGIAGKWQDGAALADGKFMNIDQNQQVAHIAAPQDEEIARLGVELNKTYIAYGRRGAERKNLQEAQDKNAESAKKQGAEVQRAVSKASGAYKNEAWDLVDATAAAPAALKAIKEEELPAEMKNMDEKQREAYVKGKAEEREALQKKISELNEARRKFVAEKEKEQATAAGAKTLDAAIINAIREQGQKKNYEFK
ncbi:MAG TPA: vWA domain-containing protein [Planctomycetota bacterium]|nr:vWA domain-containing protein [Planctomycetota bacterium]